MEIALIATLALALGVAAGFGIRWVMAARDVASAETRARKLVTDAQAQAEEHARAALLEVKEEIAAMRRDAEEDVRVRREETRRREGRLAKREESAEAKGAEVDRAVRALAEKSESLDRMRDELARAQEEERRHLEQVARMTTQEAKDSLIGQLTDQAKREAMATVREIEQRAREEAEARARKIVTIAIQRVASEQTAESTVSVFTLPSDDLKGRIIGREGRNIRAFEALTGVNLIIDDTPEAVVLSSFDPVRREVGITEIHPEMVRVLGRLQYRTSYGQNVLKHLVESAHIAGAMAAELGIDPELPKRAALMHDIGKALTHEVEGSHALIGAELARRLKEPPEVVHAIESHHGEVEQRTIEAVLAQTADAISGGRPGARRESIEQYVKRLERLQGIC